MIITYNLIKDLEDHFRYSNSDCGELIEFFLEKIIANRRAKPYLFGLKIKVYIIHNEPNNYEELSDIYRGYEVLFIFKQSENVPHNICYLFSDELI